MSKILTSLCLLLFCLTLSGRTFAAGLEASLDRTRIVEGETLVLTLSAPGDTRGVPDLSPLTADFEVTNQGQSTRMSIVNGRTSSTHEWQLLLAPKRAGALIVPSLELGGHTSEPLSVEVLPAARAAEVGETLPVLLEVEVDQAAPYVQGQVVYRTRVLSRVKVHQGNLSDPVAEGAIIERLGEDSRFEEQRNGQRYQVIERRYALFPQHSGSLRIQAPVLTGEIPEERRASGGRRGSMFGGALSQDFERFFGRDPFEGMGSFFQPTRPIRVNGRELTLEVRPQPADAASPWLPAESLQLTETWSAALSEVRVGEPVTRTIAIRAQGLTDAQLPELDLPVPDGIRGYPDRARTETRAEGEDLISVKELKLALVPSVEGELTLPEVRLAWWDTQNERQRIAALPARKVRVLPAPAGQPALASEPAIVPAEVPPDPRGEGNGGRPSPDIAGVPAGPSSAVSAARASRPFPADLWPWISAGLSLAWLATLGLWLRERRKAPKAGSSPAIAPNAPKLSLSEARARIKRSCAAGDPGAARDSLLAWASANWPADPPRRLEDLALRLNGSAAQRLRELDRSLYASTNEPWDGAAAWDGLAPSLASVSREATGARGKITALPPLYPQLPASK